MTTHSVTGSILAAVLGAALVPGDLAAQRRVAVKRRTTRTTVVVHRGFPLRRTLPRAVVVRPARTTVVVGAPVTFLPPVLFAATVVSLPARDRLVWEDTERILRSEDWVDLHFGLDRRGEALLLDVQGRSQLNFAEVTFANGHAQVVDFQDRTYSSGLYTLLDFADGRHVKTVRLLARSSTPDTTFRLLLRH
jgi:hypothetical protein